MKNKKRATTAPKKTWGGWWFLQGSFFVAIFVTSGQEMLRKAPRLLAATRCSQLEKMKRKLLFGLLAITLLSGCAIIQEEIETIDIEMLTESNDEVHIYSSSPIRIELDERIYFWSELDIEYSGNLELYFQVQLVDSSGKPVGLLLMNPLDIDTRVMCVERSSDDKTSYSCTGRIHNFIDPEGIDYITSTPAGDYTFNVMMYAKGYETLDIEKAKLILKK